MTDRKFSELDQRLIKQFGAFSKGHLTGGPFANRATSGTELRDFFMYSPYWDNEFNSSPYMKSIFKFKAILEAAGLVKISNCSCSVLGKWNLK